MSVQILSNEEFPDIICGTKSVIIDFYADWCGPCKMIAPLFDELAAENTDISFYKMNVDNCPDIASQYNITQVPTFVGFKNGVQTRSISGAKPKEDILALVK